MTQGHDALERYLREARPLPLRDYLPLVPGTLVERFGGASCRGRFARAEPDDDINYTVLALLLLEQKGAALETVDVARAWLRLLPAGAVFTAERAAYRTLVAKAAEYFVFGAEPGFDLAECSANEYNDWIGAQIRADLYGWVCPGRPALAADLARRDAALSHRGAGVHGAMFVAALGAALPAARDLDAALEAALAEIPADGEAAAAVRFGRAVAGRPGAVPRLRERYAGLSPVHTLNNLALVVWALAAAGDDYGAAVGEAVAAGWDTDCNGATVGGLFGLRAGIPEAWTRPWAGRVAVSLAGYGELALDELVERTLAVARALA
jgi:ADP-ribosylglycohydrolase